MTILGWDMSHFDAPNVGDALSQGISFLTHKAGGDSNAGDPELAAWWQNVEGSDPATTLLGTYWVPRPDLYPDPAREADRWIGTVDGRCPGWRNRPHMLQMDAERWPGGDRTRPGRAYLQALGDRLMNLMPKLRPICYASKGQYGNELAGLSFPLWNARYPSSSAGDFRSLYAAVGGDRGPGWETYSGQMPAIWQYTSSANIGGQTTCDANAYRGTLAELISLVAPGWTEDIVTKDDLQAIAQAVASKLHLDYSTPTSGLAKDQAASEDRVAKAVVAAMEATTLDENAIIAGVLAGLSPEKIAAAIPADLAQQVADILAQRLES